MSSMNSMRNSPYPIVDQDLILGYNYEMSAERPYTIQIQTSPEMAADFLAVAKQSAREKVADIMGDSFYAHGFTRFGPYWSKSGSEFAPQPEEIDPSIDRLRGNLKHGILSFESAKRREIKLSRNWNDQVNKDHVSLINKYPGSYIDALGIAVTAARGNNSGIAIPDGELWALLVDPDLETHDADNQAIDYRAVLRRWRVPRGRLCGLVNSDLVSNPAVVDEAVDLMLDVYAKRPKLFLPIYDISGDLYWPEYVPSDKIVDYIKIAQLSNNIMNFC